MSFLPPTLFGQDGGVKSDGVPAMTASPITIVFALFPGVTQLDFTGPHQVLSRLPGAEVILASRAGGAIEADGITFAGLRRLADIERCDVICVPGGFGITDDAIADQAFLRELRRLAAARAMSPRSAPARWCWAPPGCCAASAPPATGPGATCCRRSARSPIPPAWCATAMSSPAAASPPASISR